MWSSGPTSLPAVMMPLLAKEPLRQGGTSLTLAGLNTNDLFEIIGAARSMARLKSSSLSPQ
jgi:hypothetical protein